MLHKYELTFQFSTDHAAVTTDLQIGAFRPYITGDPNVSRSIFDEKNVERQEFSDISRHMDNESRDFARSIILSSRKITLRIIAIGRGAFDIILKKCPP